MLNRRKENALIALQELLTNIMTDRPEISNESKAIENALTNVEDVDNYVVALNVYKSASTNYAVELAAVRK